MAVSKLTIKACKDNKFSSFSGEFNTSINPADITIESGVDYHVARGMSGPSLLRYAGVPPRLLSFTLVFDNTGLVSGSDNVPVKEKIKQLEHIAYNVQGKAHAPNYIRVIWGQLDFKGRLLKLETTYSMFRVGGEVIRAEARVVVLEELSALGSGRSASVTDSNHAKASEANPSALQKRSKRDISDNQSDFKATPNGIAPYNDAPKGAYDGGPDHIYQGASSGNEMQGVSGRDVSSAVAPNPVSPSSRSMRPATAPAETMADAGPSQPSHGGKDVHAMTTPVSSVSSTTGQGGVANYGPGGHGGGVGGGKVNSADHSKKTVPMAQPQGGNGAVLGKQPDKRNWSNSLREAATRSGAGIGAGLLSGTLSGGLLVGAVAKMSWWERLKFLAKKVKAKASKAIKSNRK